MHFLHTKLSRLLHYVHGRGIDVQRLDHLLQTTVRQNERDTALSVAPRVRSSATISRLQEQKSAYEPAQHTWMPPPTRQAHPAGQMSSRGPKTMRAWQKASVHARAPRMKPHRGVVVVDGGGVVHGHGRDRGVLTTGAVDMKRSAAIKPTSLFRPLRTDTKGHQNTCASSRRARR